MSQAATSFLVGHVPTPVSADDPLPVTGWDPAEGVVKVAMLVWDTDLMQWVRWDGGAGTGGGSSSADRTTLVDQASATVLYVGKAAVGAVAGSPSWQIKRVTSDASGNPLAIQFAAGGAFSQVWDNRAALAYA